MTRTTARSARAGAIVLVEGESDRAAVQAGAERRGLELAREEIELVVLGGVQAIGPWLREHNGRPDGRRVVGLYDIAEQAVVRRALERHGLGLRAAEAGLEASGFFACDRDLEEELIRALGAETVLAVVGAQGDGPAFATLQRQPEWRGRPVEAQLRRFMGSGSRRKIRYGRLLVEALPEGRALPPVDGVLTCALRADGR